VSLDFSSDQIYFINQDGVEHCVLVDEYQGPVETEAHAMDARRKGSLDFEFDQGSQVQLLQALAITSLELTREQPPRVFNSSVRSGTLNFTEFRERTISLAPGSRLQIIPAGQGELTLESIALEADGMRSHFTGNVAGITLANRSLMPTYFEWLGELPLVGVLWAALGVLVSVATIYAVPDLRSMWEKLIKRGR
jgi:hypothetical protein